MDIHGPLQTRGETRCPGGVSVSCACLASRTRHECPRHNKGYIWRLDTGCRPTLYRKCHSHNTPGKRHNNTLVEPLTGNCTIIGQKDYKRALEFLNLEWNTCWKWSAENNFYRGCWELASCQGLLNSVQWLQRRSRKHLSQSEVGAAILVFRSSPKHKFGKGRWNLASCHVFLSLAKHSGTWGSLFPASVCPSVCLSVR